MNTNETTPDDLQGLQKMKLKPCNNTKKKKCAEYFFQTDFYIFSLLLLIVITQISFFSSSYEETLSKYTAKYITGLTIIFIVVIFLVFALLYRVKVNTILLINGSKYITFIHGTCRTIQILLILIILEISLFTKLDSENFTDTKTTEINSLCLEFSFQVYYSLSNIKLFAKEYKIKLVEVVAYIVFDIYFLYKFSILNYQTVIIISQDVYLLVVFFIGHYCFTQDHYEKGKQYINNLKEFQAVEFNQVPKSNNTIGYKEGQFDANENITINTEGGNLKTDSFDRNAPINNFNTYTISNIRNYLVDPVKVDNGDLNVIDEEEFSESIIMNSVKNQDVNKSKEIDTSAKYVEKSNEVTTKNVYKVKNVTKKNSTSKIDSQFINKEDILEHETIDMTVVKNKLQLQEFDSSKQLNNLHENKEKSVLIKSKNNDLDFISNSKSSLSESIDNLSKKNHDNIKSNKPDNYTYNQTSVEDLKYQNFEKKNSNINLEKKRSILITDFNRHNSLPDQEEITKKTDLIIAEIENQEVVNQKEVVEPEGGNMIYKMNSCKLLLENSNLNNMNDSLNEDKSMASIKEISYYPDSNYPYKERNKKQDTIDSDCIDYQEKQLNDKQTKSEVLNVVQNICRYPTNGVIIFDSNLRACFNNISSFIQFTKCSSINQILNKDLLFNNQQQYFQMDKVFKIFNKKKVFTDYYNIDSIIKMYLFIKMTSNTDVKLANLEAIIAKISKDFNENSINQKNTVKIDINGVNVASKNLNDKRVKIYLGDIINLLKLFHKCFFNIFCEENSTHTKDFAYLEEYQKTIPNHLNFCYKTLMISIYQNTTSFNDQTYYFFFHETKSNLVQENFKMGKNFMISSTKSQCKIYLPCIIHIMTINTLYDTEVKVNDKDIDRLLCQFSNFNKETEMELEKKDFLIIREVLKRKKHFNRYDYSELESSCKYLIFTLSMFTEFLDCQLGLIKQEPVKVNLRDEIREIISAFKREQNLKRIQVKLSGDFEALEEDFFLDITKFHAILFNLLLNAMQYSKVDTIIDQNITKINENLMSFTIENYIEKEIDRKKLELISQKLRDYKKTSIYNMVNDEIKNCHGQVISAVFQKVIADTKHNNLVIRISDDKVNITFFHKRVKNNSSFSMPSNTQAFQEFGTSFVQQTKNLCFYDESPKTNICSNFNSKKNNLIPESPTNFENSSQSLIQINNSNYLEKSTDSLKKTIDQINKNFKYDKNESDIIHSSDTYSSDSSSIKIEYNMQQKKDNMFRPPAQNSDRSNSPKIIDSPTNAWYHSMMKNKSSQQKKIFSKRYSNLVKKSDLLYSKLEFNNIINFDENLKKINSLGKFCKSELQKSNEDFNLKIDEVDEHKEYSKRNVSYANDELPKFYFKNNTEDKEKGSLSPKDEIINTLKHKTKPNNEQSQNKFNKKKKSAKNRIPSAQKEDVLFIYEDKNVKSTTKECTVKATNKGFNKKINELVTKKSFSFADSLSNANSLSNFTEQISCSKYNAKTNSLSPLSSVSYKQSLISQKHHKTGSLSPHSMHTISKVDSKIYSSNVIKSESVDFFIANNLSSSSTNCCKTFTILIIGSQIETLTKMIVNQPQLNTIDIFHVNTLKEGFILLKKFKSTINCLKCQLVKLILINKNLLNTSDTIGLKLIKDMCNTRIDIVKVLSEKIDIIALQDQEKEEENTQSFKILNEVGVKSIIKYSQKDHYAKLISKLNSQILEKQQN